MVGKYSMTILKVLEYESLTAGSMKIKFILFVPFVLLEGTKTGIKFDV